MKIVDRVALSLLIVGGLNWLLVGLMDIDLVATLFAGTDAPLARIVYVIVGLCALYCFKYFTYTPRGYRDRDRL